MKYLAALNMVTPGEIVSKIFPGFGLGGLLETGPLCRSWAPQVLENLENHGEDTDKMGRTWDYNGIILG